MKKYAFNLQALLDIRIRDEENVMLKLAEKNREILAEQERIDEAHRSLTNLQSQEKERRVHAESVMMLRYSVAYRYKLKNDLLILIRNCDKLKAEAGKIAAALTEATQARKALEKVRDRRKQEWKKERLLKEQQFIDEIAGQRFAAHE